MKIIRHILLSKGSTVYAISPMATVFYALKLMAEKDVGALLVMEGEKILGIFSERDYARRVILEGKSSKEIYVEDVMSGIVYYINPENTIEECMAVMTDKKVRHLPVLENDRLAGIISIGDVVKAIIDERNLTIDQLVNYIKGS